MNRYLLLAVVSVLSLIVLLFSIKISPAHDHGRTDPNWEKMSDEEKTWIMNLKQPDNPSLSCCGLADQYRCAGPYVRNGTAYCKINDDRDDAQFNRPHVPIGTEIEIPPEKLKWDAGNPTGYAIVFMSASRLVYCFVQSTGG